MVLVMCASYCQPSVELSGLRLLHGLYRYTAQLDAQI